MTATRRNLDTPKARAASAALDASYARQDARLLAAALAARQSTRDESQSRTEPHVPVPAPSGLRSVGRAMRIS